jgi:hypothetical protein
MSIPTAQAATAQGARNPPNRRAAFTLIVVVLTTPLCCFFGGFSAKSGWSTLNPKPFVVQQGAIEDIHREIQADIFAGFAGRVPNPARESAYQALAVPFVVAGLATMLSAIGLLGMAGMYGVASWRSAEEDRTRRCIALGTIIAAGLLFVVGAGCAFLFILCEGAGMFAG